MCVYCCYIGGDWSMGFKCECILHLFIYSLPLSMCIFSFQLLPRNTSHRLHFSFLLYFCIGVCVCVLAWQTMLGPFFFIFLVSLLQSFQHPSTCLGNDTIYTHAQDPQLIATWHTEKKKENWVIKKKKKNPTTSLKMKLMKPYKGSRPCPSLCY